MSLALSIVIPVYNGADSIGELVGALETLAVPGGTRSSSSTIAARMPASAKRGASRPAPRCH